MRHINADEENTYIDSTNRDIIIIFILNKLENCWFIAPKIKTLQR